MERQPTKPVSMEDLKQRIVKAEQAMQQVQKVLRKENERSASEVGMLREEVQHVNENGISDSHASRPRARTPKVGTKEVTVASAIELDNEQMRTKLTELRAENMALHCQNQESKLREEKLKAELFALKNRTRLSELQAEASVQSTSGRERDLQAAVENRTRELRAEFERRVEAAQKNAERAVHSAEAELQDVRAERDTERRLRSDLERQRDLLLRQLEEARTPAHAEPTSHDGDYAQLLRNAHDEKLRLLEQLNAKRALADRVTFERDALRAELNACQRRNAEQAERENSLEKRLAETAAQIPQRHSELSPSKREAETSPSLSLCLDMDSEAEITELRRRLTALQSELETAAVKVVDREAEVNSLRMELTAMSSESRRLADALAEANSERERLLTTVSEEKSARMSERSRARDAAEEAERCNAQLHEELHVRSQSVAKLEKELHDRQRLLQQSLTRLEQSEAERLHLAETLERERSNLPSLNELRSQLSSATQDLLELDAHSKRVEQAFQEARESLRVKSHELTEIYNSQRALEREKRDGEFSLENARKQIVTLTKLRDDCLVDLEAALKGRQEAENRCRRLEDDAQRSANELKERVALLENESAAQMRALVSDNEKLRDEIDRLLANQSRLTQNCQRSSERCGSLERELEDVRKEAVRASQELTRLAAAFKQTREELQISANENARLKSDGLELQAEHERLLNRLEECAQLILRKEEEVRAAMQQSTSMQAAKADLEQRVAQRVAQLEEQLVSTQRRAEQDAARLHEALAKLVAANAAAESALDDRRRLENELRSTRQAAAESDVIADNLRRSLADAEQSLMVRDSTIARLELHVRNATPTSTPSSLLREADQPRIAAENFRNKFAQPVAVGNGHESLYTQLDSESALRAPQNDTASILSKVDRDLAKARLPCVSQSTIRDSLLRRERTTLDTLNTFNSNVPLNGSLADQESTGPKRASRIPLAQSTMPADTASSAHRNFQLTDEFILVPGDSGQRSAAAGMQRSTAESGRAGSTMSSSVDLQQPLETASSTSTADTVLPSNKLDGFLSSLAREASNGAMLNSGVVASNDAETALLAASEHAFTQAERDILKLRDRLEALRIKRLD